MLYKISNIVCVVDPVSLGLGLVGGIMSIGSSLFGSSQSASNQEWASRENYLNRQAALNQLNIYNAAQKDLMAQQNRFNIEQQDRMNRYNSPVAQMQRLRAAGLNPLFADVNGGTQLSPVTAASQPLGSGVDAISAGAAASQAEAGLMNAMSAQRAQQISANNSVADTALKYAQARNLDMDTKLKDIDSGTRAEQNKLNIDLLKGNVKLSAAQFGQIEEQTKNIRQQTDNLVKQQAVMDSQIELIKSEKGVNDNRAKEIYLDNLLKEETFQDQVDLVRAEVRCTRAQAQHYLSSAVMCDNQADVYRLTANFLNDTYDNRKDYEFYKTQEQRQGSEKSDQERQFWYWHQNNERLTFEIDSDLKKDLQELGIFGNLIRSVGAVMK